MRLLSVLLCCLLAASCDRLGAVGVCDLAEDPLLVGMGPGEWAAEGAAARLVEIWRTGPLGSAFPAAFAASVTGRAAIADFGSDQVVVLNADGTSIGPWPMDHPVVRAVAVAWAPDDRLLIFDLGASSVLTTDSTGVRISEQAVSDHFLNQAMASGGLDWAGLLPGGTVYLQPLAPLDSDGPEPENSTWAVLRQRPAQPRIDTIATSRARLFGYSLRASLPVPTWPRLRAATGAGMIALGGEDGAYRIRLLNEEGQIIRTVCRETSPLPPSPEEQGATSTGIEGELLQEAGDPDAYAPFGHFFLGAEGHLWVQRDRPFVLDSDPLTAVHGNLGGLFDVFDAAGNYLGEIRAPDQSRLRAAGGDRVWALENGDEGALEVVAYRLVTG
jgi:hypothetical protein